MKSGVIRVFIYRKLVIHMWAVRMVEMGLGIVEY